jgi:PAS domain S-box-containing protein
VSVAVATALRIAIDPYVVGVQYIAFLPAVMITALLGGYSARLFSAVLSAAAAWFFLLSPQWSLSIYDPAEVVGLLLFALVGLFSATLIARLRFAMEREQTESRERLHFALDAAQVGWWQYDPRRRVASGDALFKQIFDVTADEIPIEEIKKLVHPGDAERFWVDREATLDPAGPRSSAHEYRVQRRDGEVRWVEVRWFAFFEGTGRERRAASVVGTVHDITERKECQEQEHLMMREVYHRAKNLLSVVDAIARQTATKDHPEDFIRRFSERLQALSVNQDLLIRDEWLGIDIEDLVNGQLAPLADLTGPRIVAHGPKLRLNASSAQAVGLALYELATNATKYGALSTDTGRVYINWGADDITFTMSWTEREGPQVSPPQRRGFGTIVMKEMAERSLDGKVELEYAPSGVTWSLTCPAVNALEPTA